jgi:hypothetical protein
LQKKLTHFEEMGELLVDSWLNYFRWYEFLADAALAHLERPYSATGIQRKPK